MNCSGTARHRDARRLIAVAQFERKIYAYKDLLAEKRPKTEEADKLVAVYKDKLAKHTRFLAQTQANMGKGTTEMSKGKPQKSKENK